VKHWASWSTLYRARQDAVVWKQAQEPTGAGAELEGRAYDFAG